jgi:hypothetical protein
LGLVLDKLYVLEDSSLVSTADAEEALVESVKGDLLDATHLEGHGKWAKRANVLYSSKFWVANGGSNEE